MIRAKKNKNEYSILIWIISGVDYVFTSFGIIELIMRASKMEFCSRIR